MSSHLATEIAVRARYCQGGGIYRILPAAVAHPTTLDALRAVLAEARARGLSITPRGAGSAMAGSNVGDGLILDLSAFDAGVLDVDATARTARCSPAVTLHALHAVTRPLGLHLPLDPSSAAWATLGGLVATNAAGARTVQHGAMRAWVAGVTLETDDGPLSLHRGVPPDTTHPVVQRWLRDVEPLLARHRDELLASWPQTRKNTLGYDLAAWWRSGELLDIVIGSEGTLGVITEVTVRLTPILSHRTTLRVVLGERAMLVPALETIRSFNPAVLEFLESSFLRVVEAPITPKAAAVLLADLEGDVEESVHARAFACRDALTALGAGVLSVEVAGDPEGVTALWAIRHGASSRLAALTDGRQSLQVIEDGCVPPAALAKYLDAVEGACQTARIDAVMFGHAGDGHVHINLLPNVEEADWLPRVRAIYTAVADALIQLGGTPAGEHGAGRLRAPLIARFFGAAGVACFRAIQQAFDPVGRWNPGVIVPDGSDPLNRLKVGEDAVAIPDDIAEVLRGIDREAGWGRSRWRADDEQDDG